MAGYKLTKRAVTDYENIFIYGVQQFGLQLADTYIEGMETHFSDIAARPYLYRAVDHVRVGYRRSVYRSHAIYYRIEVAGVLIVRILGRQDVGAALSEA